MVAEMVEGKIVEMEHPDSEYAGMTVYWVVVE